MNIYEHMATFASLTASGNRIIARAEREGGREYTPAERAELDRLSDAVDETQAKIDAMGGIPGPGRKTAPQMPMAQSGLVGGGPGRTAGQSGRGDNGGYANLGEFAQDLSQASRGQINPRLMNVAPAQIGTEGVGTDGGFTVPPDFRTAIWRKVAGEDSLLARTDQQVTGSNNIQIPSDETTPWDASGGIQTYWESEAGELTASKPKLGLKTIRLNKLTCLVTEDC